MPNNNKNKNVAQSFEDGYRSFTRTIKKFGPGEKNVEEGRRKRRRNHFRDAKHGIA